MPPKRRTPKEVAVQVRKKRKIISDHAQTGQTNEALQAEDTSAHNQACSDVFSTTEILECILEHLPPKTLFLVQQVNKDFQATIATSPQIQRKMFLRIDNKPATTWEVRDFGQGMRAFGWLFVHGDPADNNPRNSTLPVVLNPCLKQLDISRNAVWRAFNGGETLELNHQDSLTLQQLEQHGNRGFLSDPHCKTIKVRLGLRFGIRVYITVESTVESETPLTINAVIARTLDTSGRIVISWHGGPPRTEARG